jgi:hypothetical protein
MQDKQRLYHMQAFNTKLIKVTDQHGYTDLRTTVKHSYSNAVSSTGPNNKTRRNNSIKKQEVEHVHESGDLSTITLSRKLKPKDKTLEELMATIQALSSKVDNALETVGSVVTQVNTVSQRTDITERTVRVDIDMVNKNLTKFVTNLSVVSEQTLTNTNKIDAIAAVTEKSSTDSSTMRQQMDRVDNNQTLLLQMMNNMAVQMAALSKTPITSPSTVTIQPVSEVVSDHLINNSERLPDHMDTNV